jgi:hypothetical protein
VIWAGRLEERFTFTRKTEALAAAAGLDGFSVVRTSGPAAKMDDLAAALARRAAARQALGVNDDGLPVHRVQSLSADPATLPRNKVVPAAAPDAALTVFTGPTPSNKKRSISSPSPPPRREDQASRAAQPEATPTRRRVTRVYKVHLEDSGVIAMQYVLQDTLV